MFNTPRRRLDGIRWYFVAVPVLALLLAACGGGGGSDADSSERAPLASALATPAASTSESDFTNEPEPYESESGSNIAVEEDGYSANLIAGSISFDRFIIRSSQLTLTVEDVGDSAVWVRDLASRRQGFVFSSSSYTEGLYQYAQVTIRVPAEQFDGTLSELQSAPIVIRVEREESSSQDVSAEYVDNESRLTALEETERRYLSLLSEADTIDEILRVEYELNTVRSEIEAIQGRQNYLDEMTAFSTISVTLQPDTGTAVSPAPDDSGFIGQIFTDAWGGSEGILQSVLTFALTASIVGLVFLPFMAIGYLMFRVIRSRVNQPVTTEPDAPATQ